MASALESDLGALLSPQGTFLRPLPHPAVLAPHRSIIVVCFLIHLPLLSHGVLKGS